MLILMAGLPGTRKTTVARQLAERLKAAILSKDTVRHALFPPEMVEYSTEQDDFVIDLLLRTAEYIWERDPEQIVILDGRTFSRESQRRHVIEFAERQRQPCASWNVFAPTRWPESGSHSPIPRIPREIAHLNFTTR